MKTNLISKNILKTICLIAGISLSSIASASIINADFSDGLNGWDADYSYFDGTDEHYYQPVIDFANFTDNFSTDSNSVTLNTSTDGVNEFFGLYLFQEFEVANDAFELSLNYEYNLSDENLDWASVTLVDENFDVVHDFINDGLAFDISNFAGSFMALEFGLEDGDFIYDDYLTVSNISISSVEVPEPSSIAIFAFALLALTSRNVIRK